MSYEDEDYDPLPRNLTAEVDGDAAVIRLKIEPPSAEQMADALARRWYADYSASKAIIAAAQERFEILVTKAIDETAEAAIAEALAQPRQPTDEFGNPVGAARTFSQMIGDQVRSWQAETVDPHNGTPMRADSYNKDRVITRAEYIVRKVGAHEFKKMAEEAVAQVRTDAKNKVAATIKDTVAASLAALTK